MPIEEIKGVKELEAATDKIARAMPEAMSNSALEFARQWISFAQSRTYDDYSNEAAQSFVVSSTEGGAEVTNSSVLFFGSEFGGQARPETMQFPPYSGHRGYWFYPARRDNESVLSEIWGKGVDVAMSPWDHRE